MVWITRYSKKPPAVDERFFLVVSLSRASLSTVSSPPSSFETAGNRHCTLLAGGREFSVGDSEGILQAHDYCSLSIEAEGDGDRETVIDASMARN